MCYCWIWDDLGLQQVATLSLSLACPLITIISYAGSSVIGRPCHIVTLFVLVGKQHKEQSDAHGMILKSFKMSSTVMKMVEGTL